MENINLIVQVSGDRLSIDIFLDHIVNDWLFEGAKWKRQHNSISTRLNSTMNPTTCSWYFDYAKRYPSLKFIFLYLKTDSEHDGDKISCTIFSNGREEKEVIFEVPFDLLDSAILLFNG